MTKSKANPENRRIKIVEDEIKEGKSKLYKDDVVTRPWDLATAYVNAGLAEDAETGEIGERSTKPVQVKVDPVVQQLYLE